MLAPRGYTSWALLFLSLAALIKSGHRHKYRLKIITGSLPRHSWARSILQSRATAGKSQTLSRGGAGELPPSSSPGHPEAPRGQRRGRPHQLSGHRARDEEMGQGSKPLLSEGGGMRLSPQCAPAQTQPWHPAPNPAAVRSPTSPPSAAKIRRSPEGPPPGPPLPPAGGTHPQSQNGAETPPAHPVPPPRAPSSPRRSGPKARSSSSPAPAGPRRAQGKTSCGASVLRQPRGQKRASPSGPGPLRVVALREPRRRQSLRTNMRKTEVRKMMKTQGSTMELTERKRRALRSAFSLKSAANAPMYARICPKQEASARPWGG